MSADAPRPRHLRALVLAETGQDVRRCSHCDFCSALLAPDQDVSLQMLVQLILLNDEEALTTRTLWSDEVLQSAQHVCSSNLNMEAVLLVLRAEAERRGLTEDKA